MELVWGLVTCCKTGWVTAKMKEWRWGLVSRSGTRSALTWEWGCLSVLASQSACIHPRLQDTHRRYRCRGWPRLRGQGRCDCRLEG